MSYLTIRNPSRLSATASAYDKGTMRRPQADPLGYRKLPADRDRLNNMAEELCDRLATALGDGLTSRRLVVELGLESARALRLLVAYCRVWGGVHQIVGIPGDRYYWGDAKPGAYQQMISDCTRRGRCYLFIAALHRRQGVAMATAQMVFDWFAETKVSRELNDDLAALTAAEGVKIGDVFSAFCEIMSRSDEGRTALADAGKRHASLFMPATLQQQLLANLDAVRASIANLQNGSHGVAQ